MPEVSRVSEAFLEQKPKAAAVLLEGFPLNESTEFLQHFPAKVLVPVISHMSSWPATRLLTALPEKLAAEVLNELSELESETMLRLMSADQRAAIFVHLPGSLAKRFAQKLVYPLSTVGAWMSTSMLWFTPDNTVGDCLDIVKHHKSQLGGVLIVVDGNRHLLGLVEVEKLLICEDEQLLVELINREVEPLSAHATLWEVAHHEGWTDFPSLPVVDHSQIMLGVLTHSALKSGTQKAEAQSDDVRRFSLITHMSTAFFVSVGGLLHVISNNPGGKFK